MILGCSDGDEKVVAAIPSSYVITSTDPSFSFRTAFNWFESFLFLLVTLCCRQAILSFPYPLQPSTPCTIKEDSVVTLLLLLRHLLAHQPHLSVITIPCNLWLLRTTVFLKDFLLGRPRLTESCRLFTQPLLSSTAIRCRLKIFKHSMLTRLICTQICIPTFVKVFFNHDGNASLPNEWFRNLMLFSWPRIEI